jgi:hypothetical protein
MADKNAKSGWTDREIVSTFTIHITPINSNLPQLVCLLNVMEYSNCKLEYGVSPSTPILSTTHSPHSRTPPTHPAATPTASARRSTT